MLPLAAAAASAVAQFPCSPTACLAATPLDSDKSSQMPTCGLTPRDGWPPSRSPRVARSGRFNRLDPFAGSFDDPQSLHKFLYGNASPIAFVDPSGYYPSTISTLSKAVLGIFVHSFIGREFKSLGGLRWANQFVRTITRDLGGRGGYFPFKPDLAEAVSRTRGTIYEIKPGEILAQPWALQAWPAAPQLFEYLFALNFSTNIPWRLGSSYLPGAKTWPEFTYNPPGWVLVTFNDYIRAPGVHLYDFIPRNSTAAFSEAVVDLTVAAALLDQMGLVAAALAQARGLAVWGARAALLEEEVFSLV